jgi:hypothetical protein
MASLSIALLLRPLALLVLLGLICLPARLAVRRWMPEGRLKRLLLFPVRKHP